MVKNIILTISVLINVAILIFAIWAYVMFNKGFFSYAMTNAGIGQVCTTEFGSEQENALAKKWCEKMTKCMEEENNAVETPSPSIKGQEEGQPGEAEELAQKVSEYCEEHNIPECLPVTSYSVVDLDDKYAVVKNGDFNYLLTKKDNEWNVSVVSQENNICDTGSDSPDLIEYCGGIASSFITKKDDEEIVQKISAYCEKYNIQECLPVTPTADSREIIDFDGKYAVIKVGSFNYLLTKNGNEWNVSIVSQEEDICDTGTDNPDLAEYCSN